MEKALNKIAEIIHDAKFEMIDSAESRTMFLSGYLIALQEHDEITSAEYFIIMKFFKNITKDTVFLVKES